jgi:hypothetical protein
MCSALTQARTRVAEFIKLNDGLKGNIVRVVQILFKMLTSESSL